MLDEDTRRQRRRACDAKYRAEHRDQIAAYQAKYQAAHREQKAVVSAKYRAEHREQSAAYQAKYLAEHREQKAAASAKYHAAHRAQRAAYRVAYRAAHREQAAARQRVWRAANIGQSRAFCTRRSARRRGAAISDLTRAQWDTIKAAFGQRCAYCGVKTSKLTQDHIIPLSKGGNHTASNVVPACKPCNSRKHAGPPLKPVQPVLLA